MNRYSSTPDLTAVQSARGPGMDQRILWMCGHRSNKGVYRRIPGMQRLALRCAACAEKNAKAV